MKEKEKMIRNAAGNIPIAQNAFYALGFWDRFRGMMGKKFDEKMDCMVFPACSSIHMFFMGTALDVIFLDKEKKVVKKITAKPWRIYWGGRGTDCVLELPAGKGKIELCRTGDTLEFEERMT